MIEYVRFLLLINVNSRFYNSCLFNNFISSIEVFLFILYFLMVI